MIAGCVSILGTSQRAGLDNFLILHDICKRSDSDIFYCSINILYQ